MTGWWYIPLPGGSTEKCAISKDDNRIYMVSRSQGVYIIDISNKNNLNLFNYLLQLKIIIHFTFYLTLQTSFFIIRLSPNKYSIC